MGRHRNSDNLRANRNENIYNRHNDERPFRERLWEALTLRRRRNAWTMERARRTSEAH